MRHLAEAGASLDEVDRVAVTRGPGLIGALLVGVTYGKALAQATGNPKTLSTALAVSAAAYGASGDYATAAKDAQRALERDRGPGPEADDGLPLDRPQGPPPAAPRHGSTKRWRRTGINHEKQAYNQKCRRVAPPRRAVVEAATPGNAT